MNITPFVNSKDIADGLDCFLREEAAEDLPTKYAWLIWQSTRASLSEKHSAWQEIVDTMPDNVLPLRGGEYEGSLHALLREYIGYERSLAEVLQSEEKDAVFTVSLRFGRDDLRCDDTDTPVFRALSETLNAIREEYGNAGELKQVIVTKKWPGNMRKRMDAVVSPSRWELMRISGTETERPAPIDAFSWLWFDFPTPFRRGDILVSSDGVPIVLERICTWTQSDANWECGSDPVLCKPTDGQMERWRACGDVTDMHCQGYFVSTNGRIYHAHHPHNYMDMEYYCGELAGYQRVLKAVSNYLKGRIRLDVLLNACQIIRSEETVANDRLFLGVNDDWMELAGLR